MNPADQEAHVIVTTDEDGTETEWNIVDRVEVNGRNYVFCLMADRSADLGEEDGAIVLRVDPNGDGTESLAEITDDAELEAVLEAMENDGGAIQ